MVVHMQCFPAIGVYDGRGGSPRCFAKPPRSNCHLAAISFVSADYLHVDRNATNTFTFYIFFFPHYKPGNKLKHTS